MRISARHTRRNRRKPQLQRANSKLAANVRWDKLAESQRSKREQYAEERKKLDADRAADLISEAKYRQAKADLDKKYEEKAKAAPKLTEADRELARMAKLDADEAARRIASSQRVGEAMAKRLTPSGPKVDTERAAQEAVG